LALSLEWSPENESQPSGGFATEWLATHMVDHPVLLEIAFFQQEDLKMSVSNTDLPNQAWKAQLLPEFRRKLEQFAAMPMMRLFRPVELNSMPASAYILGLLEESSTVEHLLRHVLDTMRLSYVGTGRSTAPQFASGPIRLDTVVVRPVRGPRVALLYHDESGSDIIAAQNHGEPIMDGETKAAYYYCLGWNDPATAQGKPFTPAQIPGKGIDDDFRLAVVRTLVAKGFLLPVKTEAREEGQQPGQGAEPDL